MSRINVVSNVIIKTERGNFRIHDYIQTIKEDENFGGDFELSIAYDIFNINIAQYLIGKDANNNIINLKFIKYINDDNNEKKNLLLLIYENGAHFMVAYYNNTKLKLNFNPTKSKTDENNNIREKKNNNNKYILKDLSQLF